MIPIVISIIIMIVIVITVLLFCSCLFTKELQLCFELRAREEEKKG